MKNQILWTTTKKKRILAFRYDGKELTLDLIRNLAINEICTTKQIAENILKAEQVSKHEKINKFEISKKSTTVFYKIHDRHKYDKTIPGFISKGFVTQVGNERGINHPGLYSLTLRGCILSLGINLNYNELKKFILSHSKRYIFFSYLRDIIDLYSFDIVKKFYIKPIQELISNGNIDLTDGFSLSFSQITEKCCLNLFQELKKEKKSVKNKQKIKLEEKFSWVNVSSYSNIVGLKIYDNSETDDVFDCKLTYKISEEMNNTLINFSAFEL